MLLLGNASLDVIWGMRALVSAEDARATALAHAVGDLEQFAQTKSEPLYRHFLKEIAAVNALRDARKALEQPRADIALAKQRLRDAGTPSHDATALVDLYRRFRGVAFITTTSTLWEEADAQAKELEAIGETLQAAAPLAKTNAILQPAVGRIR